MCRQRLRTLPAQDEHERVAGVAPAQDLLQHGAFLRLLHTVDGLHNVLGRSTDDIHEHSYRLGHLVHRQIEDGDAVIERMDYRLAVLLRRHRWVIHEKLDRRPETELDDLVRFVQHHGFHVAET